MMDKEKILKYAQIYIDNGWGVIPLCYPQAKLCTCGRHEAHLLNPDKVPDCSPGKSPHYRLRASSARPARDIDQVKQWLESGEFFNLGIVAGAASGLVIVDVDPPHGGKETIVKLLGAEKIKTPMVLTGSGGCHYYFALPSGAEARNSAGSVGPGVDIRGRNGYVVAPPSAHISGKIYTWLEEPTTPLVEAPAWTLQKNAEAKPAAISALPDIIPEGQRDNKLASIAGRLRRSGCDEEIIYGTLTAVNKNRCVPPLPDADVRRIARSIARYKPAEDSEFNDYDVLNNDRPDTIAKAFEKWQNELGIFHKYHPIDGWSMCKDNKYQKIADEDKLARYIRIYISQLVKFKKIRKTENGEKVETLVDPDKSQLSSHAINNVIEYLKTLETVYLYDKQAAPCSLDNTLDAQKVIALRNGLLDLSNPATPRLLPLTPAFYTFNYLPFDYDPEAQCPTWDWALGQYFQDENGQPDAVAADALHSWMKKWLLRDTSHHKIFAIIGQRRSGKSTMGRVINALLGPNNVATLTISQLSKNFGLQPLLNKQLGILWDASVGGNAAATLEAVEMLKCISGQDPVSVDRKNKERLDNITLRMSILIIANKVLDLRDSTGALAGRFTFLETTGSFYGKEDPTIEEQLMQELPGIFNKVLRAKDGRILEHPKSIALQESFEELSSPYIAFIQEWCDVEEGQSELFCPTDVLWHYYCAWARRNEHNLPSKQKFKLEFSSSHKAISKFKAWLRDDQELTLCERYKLNQIDAIPSTPNNKLDLARAASIRIGKRPYCYRNIDIKEEYLDGWQK